MQTEDDLASVLRGLVRTPSQEVDLRVVDSLRNFKFGPPGAGSLGLVALNIQRGRDHGLPDDNVARVLHGLEPVTTFVEVTSDVELQNALSDLYGSVYDSDIWVGSLEEDPLPGSPGGELLSLGLRLQFERLRDGDRFWYSNAPAFSQADLNLLEETTLSAIIQRNTNVSSFPDDVMQSVPEPNLIGLAAIGLLMLMFFALQRKFRHRSV